MIRLTFENRQEDLKPDDYVRVIRHVKVSEVKKDDTVVTDCRPMGDIVRKVETVIPRIRVNRVHWFSRECFVKTTNGVRRHILDVKLGQELVDIGRVTSLEEVEEVKC
jgi:hypothetical protein